MSPVVLVIKKDGPTKFHVDYHKVNEVACKDAYPLPDDTLDALQGFHYFSTLDVLSHVRSSSILRALRFV